jgi:4-amino-4-deoxy-L-arabinose transferase-like glycosyltransferase
MVESDASTRIDRCSDLSARTVYLTFAGLFLLNLLLRVFYFRYQFVNGDEAVRALTAVRMLEGARLYLDVITDKPPGTTLFYATVFALFGRSMAAVHLAAAVWNFATSFVIYLTAARLYSKRTGLWAALLFVYFSTNYLTQDVMAANTELLMVLPYTASFYFYMNSRHRASEERDSPKRTGGKGAICLLIAGLMSGFSFIFKQVGIFNLAFFALDELRRSARRRAHGGLIQTIAARALVRLSLIAVGFALAVGALLLWLAGTGALAGFWRNAVVLGALYVGSLPRALWFKFMIGRTGGYILFNATLWALALIAAIRSIERRRSAGVADLSERDSIDGSVALWALVSLSGVFTSGRFYGHYFIQALPALSLLGARGVELVTGWLRSGQSRRRAGAVVYALVATFVFSFVRFHHRTAILAYETIASSETRWSQGWGMSKREKEAASIAQVLRDRLGEGAPLYIWGYALDVYWRSGCRPASRYLTPYYVTGHFYPEVADTVDGPQEPFWREARAQFIEDLKRTHPRWILNADEAILTLPYPEIVGFIESSYRYEGQLGSDPDHAFLVYQLRESRH